LYPLFVSKLGTSSCPGSLHFLLPHITMHCNVQQGLI
jgi:hypothetical protein